MRCCVRPVSCLLHVDCRTVSCTVASPSVARGICSRIPVITVLHTMSGPRFVPLSVLEPPLCLLCVGNMHHALTCRALHLPRVVACSRVCTLACALVCAACVYAWSVPLQVRLCCHDTRTCARTARGACAVPVSLRCSPVPSRARRSVCREWCPALRYAPVNLVDAPCASASDSMPLVLCVPEIRVGPCRPALDRPGSSNFRAPLPLSLAP